MITPSTERKRPVSLLLAMLLCSVMAMAGMTNGFTELVHFRSNATSDAPLRAGVDAADHEATVQFVRAWGQALDRARQVRLPLATANMLLSFLLLVTASRASGGRPGSRTFALQGVGANAALAVADFTLSRDYRADVVAACASYWSRTGLWGGTLTEQALADRAWGSFRFQLALALGAYALAAAALSSQAARAYLAPAAETGPDAPGRDEDPDEDD